MVAATSIASPICRQDALAYVAVQRRKRPSGGGEDEAVLYGRRRPGRDPHPTITVAIPAIVRAMGRRVNPGDDAGLPGGA